MVQVIITNVILNGIWSLSGGIIGNGRNTTTKTKKLIKLAVSTFADGGRVFFKLIKGFPIKARRMILIACPPQYIWIPIHMHAFMMRFNTGQKP